MLHLIADKLAESMVTQHALVGGELLDLMLYVFPIIPSSECNAMLLLYYTHWMYKLLG